MMHPAGPYSTNRLFEWCMAIMMVLIALTLALPGNTLDRAAVRAVAELGLTEESIAALFGMVGAARVLALWLNGHINNGRTWPNGANIRAVGAAIGCVFMGQFTVALFWDSYITGLASLFVPVLGTLAAGEAMSCYVARLDAVDRRDRLGRALTRIEQLYEDPAA